MSRRVSVTTQVDVEIDLGEIDKSDLIAEIRRRESDGTDEADDLQLDLRDLAEAVNRGDTIKRDEMVSHICWEYGGRLVTRIVSAA